MSRSAARAAAGLAAAVLAAVLGCGRGQPVPERPQVHWGEEECGYCRMIVADRRFAAAVADPGRQVPFDDVGCLLAHLRARPEAPARIWVHASDGELWLAAEEARYVHRPGFATPMGSGWVAFAGEAEAEAFAAEGGGRVRGWQEMMQDTAAHQATAGADY